MPNTCPACSRLNPAGAVYCHYDGRNLTGSPQTGALNVGGMAFAMPFCFADGRSCANFNQLALACDERWDESKDLLREGTWASFFTAVGRLDLAAAAKEAAKESDRDVGLSRLLEKFPVDTQTLRPPKLAVPTKEENLGTLAPGTNKKFELMLSNQGMLVLRGMIFTDCDWLAFGTPSGGNQKIFQTRGVFSIPVHVIGHKLRAGLKPLQGEIVIDTNGGTITIPIKAVVPTQPFPKGKYANDSLAGARTPRELAVKAKEAPADAGMLFEQGAVKSWYTENGWTYPVEGTIGSGKAAVQQFFEALGLTKPPVVELQTESITVSGVPGEKIIKKIVIGTKETKPVYAQGASNQSWVNVGVVKFKGTSVTLPIEITVPSKPGQHAEAAIHIHANGRKQFTVPVSVTIADKPIEQSEEEESAPSNPLVWMFAGALVLLLMAGVGVGVWWAVRPPDGKAPPIAVMDKDKKDDSAPAGDGTQKPVINQAGPWWAKGPSNRVGEIIEDLKRAAPQESATVDALAAKDADRLEAYRQVLKRAPNMMRDNRSKEQLARLLAECYAFEPVEANVSPIREWLAAQMPAENVAFAALDKNDSLDRMFWSVRTAVECFTHDAIRTNRVKLSPTDERLTAFAQALGASLNVPADPNADPVTLKIEAEKQLATRLYRSAAATAGKSLDDALWLRNAVAVRAPEYLSPAFRQGVDANIMFAGLAGGDDAWAKVEPMVKDTLASPDLQTRLKLVAFYENAPPPVSTKLEGVFASKWKEAADPALDQKTKAEVIRTVLLGGTPTALVKKALAPAERQKKMQALAESALAAAKSPSAKKLAILQDTVRLAHANTMAAILLQKEADVKRFDEFVAKVPEIDQTDETKPENKKDPKGGPADVVTLGQQPKVIDGFLDAKCERDTVRVGSFRKVYRVNLQKGQAYTFTLTTNAFDAYLRLESPTGQELAADDDSGGGRNARLIIGAPTDGAYRVIATSLTPAIGPYSLQLQVGAAGGFGDLRFPPPMFGNPFFGKRRPFGLPPFGPLGPIGPDGMPLDPQQKREDQHGVNATALASLDNKQASVRTGGFLNIAAKVPDDMTPRIAQKISRYVLVVAKKDELDEVAGKLNAFAQCRNFLLALSDQVSREEILQKSAETVVGGVLGESLKFANNEDWRTSCRKVLLERVLDMTETKRGGADEAADLLRDLYKEQGIAFGMNPEAELGALTRPTQVLAAVVKRVAAKAGDAEAMTEDKEFLAQIDRRLQVAQFVAENDLEQMVLLQRLWARVLAIRLGQLVPDQADAFRKLQSDLSEGDRRAAGSLEQLRAGEEKTLRMWAIVNQAKKS
ncbi:MAG: PPC domain-containing protein [Gemmataceae bacterium]|nr:PPC domain-containing protein [Gemmataceae bacterium]